MRSNRNENSVVLCACDIRTGVLLLAGSLWWIGRDPSGCLVLHCDIVFVSSFDGPKEMVWMYTRYSGWCHTDMEEFSIYWPSNRYRKTIRYRVDPVLYTVWGYFKIKQIKTMASRNEVKVVVFCSFYYLQM